MTREITVFTGLVAIMMLFGISVVIFYYKWEGFMKKVLKTNKEVRAELGYTDTPEPEVPEKPLAERFYQSGGPVVVVLLILFPLLYILLKNMLFLRETDGMQGGIAGFIMILFILFTIVVGVLGLYEKNPKRQFWMELVPTIALEALLALFFAIELNFDNGHHTGRHSTIEGLVLFLGIFFGYTVKTCRNWKRMHLAKEAEQEYQVDQREEIKK